jgi:hypothetical protein
LKEFTFKAKNFNSLSKLFKYQVSKYNDLCLFPGLPASSRLAQSGFHVSFHASGQAQLALNSPVACLRLGPKLYLPFNRTDLLNDIIATNNSLFKHMDVSNVTQGGVVAILKTESMITNF